MNPNSDLLRYMEARAHFFKELEVTKGRLDRLLDDLVSRPITLNDLARLEGLHQEKRRLFTNFVATEEHFVTQILAQRSAQVKTDGVS